MKVGHIPNTSLICKFSKLSYAAENVVDTWHQSAVIMREWIIFDMLSPVTKLQMQEKFKNLAMSKFCLREIIAWHIAVSSSS